MTTTLPEETPDSPIVPDLDFTEPPQGADGRAFMESSAMFTAKEMNSKFKETSAGGLAVSLTLC